MEPISKRKSILVRNKSPKTPKNLRFQRTFSRLFGIHLIMYYYILIIIRLYYLKCRIETRNEDDMTQKLKKKIQNIHIFKHPFKILNMVKTNKKKKKYQNSNQLLLRQTITSLGSKKRKLLKIRFNLLKYC